MYYGLSGVESCAAWIQDCVMSEGYFIFKKGQVFYLIFSSKEGKFPTP